MPLGAHLRRGRSGGRVLPGPTLVEVVVGDGLGVGGIELWGLVEVVWSGTQGDLLCFGIAETEVEAVWGGPRAGWSRGGEVGSPMWARIWPMGRGSDRAAVQPCPPTDDGLVVEVLQLRS